MVGIPSTQSFQVVGTVIITGLDVNMASRATDSITFCRPGWETLTVSTRSTLPWQLDGPTDELMCTSRKTLPSIEPVRTSCSSVVNVWFVSARAVALTRTTVTHRVKKLNVFNRLVIIYPQYPLQLPHPLQLWIDPRAYFRR